MEPAERLRHEEDDNGDGRMMCIREVSALTGVPPHTLRFWEKEMPNVLCPKRTPGGQRRYDSEMTERVRMIKHLSEGRGYSLAAIRERLGANPDFESRPTSRKYLQAERALELIADEVARLLKERLLTLLETGEPGESGNQK